MRIAHFNTQAEGGSAVLMSRLHQALLAAGVESRIYYRRGQLLETGGQKLDFAEGRTRNIAERLFRRWERTGAAKGRNLYVRMALPFDTAWPIRQELPDVVHLHWVSLWLDLPSLLSSLPRHIPLVWTMHDLGAMTGGCHLYDGCDGFQQGCPSCPLLRLPFRRFFAAAEVRRKRRALAGRLVYVVGNSEWTTGMARRSAVFREAAGFCTIHPAIAAEQFKPIDKAQAKQLLGISPATFTVGFGCAELTDANKNFPAFLELLRRVAAQVKVQAVVFGNGLAPLEVTPAQIHYLGKLQDPAALSRAYSAMDVFVMTSRIETFGQVALEAQACGTPVCAFAVGGLGDAVEHGETGYLCSPGDLEALTQAVLTLANDSITAAEFAAAAGHRARTGFAIQTMADRYLELYTEAVAPST